MSYRDLESNLFIFYMVTSIHLCLCLDICGLIYLHVVNLIYASQRPHKGNHTSAWTAEGTSISTYLTPSMPDFWLSPFCQRMGKMGKPTDRVVEHHKTNKLYTGPHISN